MNPPPSQPPPPPSAATILPSHHQNPPPPASLPTALSNLTSLLHLSATALHSLPTPAATTSATSSTLIPCPFNPNHRLPPSSLFSHYLNCPSPISLPHTFHYPDTHSSSITASAPSIPTTSSDLTVSLQNYIGYSAPTNNFFYQSCPGPFTPSIQPPPLLNIPRVLYAECADLNNDSTWEKVIGFSVDFIKFLPSEIWAIRSEMEAWGGGFPAGYSSRILRAILRLRDCKLLHLYEWVVSSSPRYGIIIDFAMRDHVVLLIRLCLKVIVKEALGLAGVNFSNEELKTEESILAGLGNRSFECPVLVKAMMWLALQFSILYGKVNGKFLSVNVLKECISESALQASLFPLERKSDELSDLQKVDGEVEEPVQNVVSMDDTKRDEGEKNIKGKTVGSSKVFISQVAAAVAALHERSLIEDKIKALRNSRPVPAYQRNMEHAHVSKIADEERQKRPDYRPIIEHDGFLWQRSTNQETNKVKTREELLAEERDYKRRRMSYRGKKLKRNTVEVMRDIIEEYMEEITQAGGIGGTSKAVEATEALASEKLNKHASETGVSGSRRNYEISEESSGLSLDYRKDLHSRHDSENFKDDIQHPTRDSSWDHGHQDHNGDVEKIRHDRDDYSGSRDGRKSSRNLREHMHGKENRDSVEAFGEGSSLRSRQRRDESHEQSYTKRNRDERKRNNYKRERQEHERTSCKREKYEDIWEHKDRGRRKTDSSYRGRDEDNSRHGDRRRSKMHSSSSSRPELHEFEDRYDPAESHDF